MNPMALEKRNLMMSQSQRTNRKSPLQRKRQVCHSYKCLYLQPVNELFILYSHTLHLLAFHYRLLQRTLRMNPVLHLATLMMILLMG
jgi:hypothetical protein